MLGLSLAGMVGTALLAFAGQPGPETRFEDGGRVTWTAAPAHADVWTDMRRAALSRSDVGQWAAAMCTIGDNRRLTDCEIIERSTPDTDVGEAILHMSRRYRAASRDTEGRPTTGRRVVLRMGYGGMRVP